MVVIIRRRGDDEDHVLSEKPCKFKVVSTNYLQKLQKSVVVQGSHDTYKGKIEFQIMHTYND